MTSQATKAVKEFTSSWPSAKPLERGNPRLELEQCATHGIHVFRLAHGRTTNSRMRAILPADTTLREAKNRLGKDLSQPHFTDDHGYEYHEADLDQPLWKFSHHCVLHLNFSFDDANSLKNGIVAAGEAAITTVVGPGVQRATNLTKGVRPLLNKL
ncbi:Phosphoglycerate mutase family protein [Balamuthia mandrillaris]